MVSGEVTQALMHTRSEISLGAWEIRQDRGNRILVLRATLVGGCKSFGRWTVGVEILYSRHLSGRLIRLYLGPAVWLGFGFAIAMLYIQLNRVSVRTAVLSVLQILGPME